MDKQDIVRNILKNAAKAPCKTSGYAFAPTNLALVKYWGKRDERLHLPMNSSLSISIAGKGAFTQIERAEKCDHYILNGEDVACESVFYKRLHKFLDLFRPSNNTFYQVRSDLNIPLAAGLASSACGFAAITKALNELYAWNLGDDELSILARLGSGSACRSLWPGFVKWQRGEREDGMDCHGVKLNLDWPELRVGLLVFSKDSKAISSREAMRRTVETSKLYATWPEKAEQAVLDIETAISQRDFAKVGSIAEQNALLMHATMLDSTPPINYSPAEILAARDKVVTLRNSGVPIYFTQDAGPNLILLFLDSSSAIVKEQFPDVEIISPPYSTLDRAG